MITDGGHDLDLREFFSPGENARRNHISLCISDC